MSKLSKTLKCLRTQRGVYQKELAVMLKVTTGTISNYEHGIHTPDPDTLIKLAEYYGVSVDYLVGHTDCPCPISTINRVIYGKYTVGQFLELLDRLPKKELPYLVYMLNLFDQQAASDKRS